MNLRAGADALAEIAAQKEKHFDPQVVEAFLTLTGEDTVRLAA